MNKDKNFEFCNLVQTQNLLDLELHELRPILYSKLLHLMKIEKPNEQSAESILARKLLGDSLIKRSKLKHTVLLDDRCIVGYVIQKQYIVNEHILKQIKLRFLKEIRYSGKNYSKKLFNALLDHSLITGKTIIIDKNIRLEPIGQGTQWKVDFTNYLVQNFESSYEWLNHMQLNALRNMGLLTLRNHLNQQMIIQRRDDINSKLQQEIQSHLNKDQQTKLKKMNLIKSKSRLSSQLNAKAKGRKRKQLKNLKYLQNAKQKDDDSSPPQTDQLNLNEQNVQEALIELGCLQNFNYVNHQLFDFIKDLDQPKAINNANAMSKNLKLANEFELSVTKKSEQFESKERADILLEEMLLNRDLDDLDSVDEMTKAMPNCKHYKHKKTKSIECSKIWRFQRFIRQTFRILRLRTLSSFRKALLNLSIRFEEIEKHHIFIEQLNTSGNLELSSPLPANVPYCQIGKSSLIAALKQFNWSHTQGPFIYNQNW